MFCLGESPSRWTLTCIVKEGNKGPAAPKQAESRPIHGESHLNHQQQWQEPGKQVPYHSQRAWSGGHHQQPRTSFPTGTQSGAPPAGGWYQQDGRRMGNRGMCNFLQWTEDKTLKTEVTEGCPDGMLSWYITNTFSDQRVYCYELSVVRLQLLPGKQ